MQAVPSQCQKYTELIVRLNPNLHLKYILFEKPFLEHSETDFETQTNFTGT